MASRAEAPAEPRDTRPACRGLGRRRPRRPERLLFQLDATGAGEPGVGRRPCAHRPGGIGLAAAGLALLPLLALPTAGVFRLAARIVRGEPGVGTARHRLAVSARRRVAGSSSACVVVGGGLVLGTNVVVGLSGGEPAGWAIATLAGWGLVVVWCGALVALAAARRPGTDRATSPPRTAFAWPAGLLLAHPLRFAGLGAWRSAVRGRRQHRPDRGHPDRQRGVRRARRLPDPSTRPPTDCSPPLARGAPVTLPIQVGPSTITMNRDDRFVVCQPDGRIERQAEEGFFARDTRFVSGYDLFLNGQRPVLLNASPVQFFSSRFEYTNPELLDRDGVVPRHSLAIRARPDGLGRRPRGLRHRQLRPAARPPDDRDRDRVRLRRHLRRQGRPARPPGRDQRPLVPLAPRAPDDLRPPRVRARAGASRPTGRTARRSSPTAGSCSSPRSRPRASGIPACAGCR